MNWFRFYHEALEDPKVQRLAPPLFKAWVNLLCLASKSMPRGALPDPDDIAFALRMDPTEAASVLAELTSRGLIEQAGGRLAIHAWDQRQRRSDDVTERVRNHRERVKKGETLPKRSGNALERETDTEQRRGEDVSPLGSPLPAVEPAPPAEAAAPPVRSEPKATPRPIPDDFAVTEPMRQAVAATGLPPDQIAFETAKFVDHFRAKGERRADWAAAWRNWMRRAPEFAPRHAAPIRAGPNGRRDIGLSNDELEAIARGGSP